MANMTRTRPGLWRQRDFRLAWAGRTASLAGDGMLPVVLVWETLRVAGGHGGTLALVLLARAIPRVLLLLVGGVVADRVNRRTLLMLADLGQACLLAPLAVLAWTGQIRLWHLIAVAALSGIYGAILLPAAPAFTVELVPAVLLPKANAAMAAGRQAAELLAGPALGGLLITVAGAGWVWGVDAATFLASALCLLAIRPPPTAARAPAGRRRRGVMADAREGLGYIRGRRWLAVTVVATGATNLVGAATMAVLLPLLIREQQQSAAVLGLALAAFGAGGLTVAWWFARRPPHRRVRATYLGLAGACAAVATLAITSNPLMLVTVVLLVGAGEQWADLAWTTALQDMIPPGLLGRVFSADQLVAAAAMPVAFAAAGPAADHYSTRSVLAALGLAGATLMLAVGAALMRRTTEEEVPGGIRR